MRRVHDSQTLSEAHLIRGLLEAGGVQAEVRGEHLTFGEGHRSPVQEMSPSVWVADDDADEARALIAAHAQPPADDAAPDGLDTSEEAHAAMSALFVIAGQLRRAPRNGDLFDDIRAVRPAIVDSQPPYGIPPALWQSLSNATGELLDRSVAGDFDAVAELAAELHTLLREYV